MLPSTSMNCVNMSKVQMQKERLDLLEIGYIFEHELNVTHILANDFGKLPCVRALSKHQLISGKRGSKLNRELSF